VSHAGFQALLLTVALVVSATGCGKESSAAGGGLEQGFAQADAAVREEIVKVAAAIKVQDYVAAVTLLDRMLREHKLTETEQTATRKAFGEINQAVVANPGLDSPEFFRARSELMKRLYGESGISDALTH
jgi:hypothetical protein